MEILSNHLDSKWSTILSFIMPKPRSATSSTLSPICGMSPPDLTLLQLNFSEKYLKVGLVGVEEGTCSRGRNWSGESILTAALRVRIFPFFFFRSFLSSAFFFVSFSSLLCLFPLSVQILVCWCRTAFRTLK